MTLGSWAVVSLAGASWAEVSPKDLAFVASEAAAHNFAVGSNLH
jgi:hypothetical protein